MIWAVLIGNTRTVAALMADRRVIKRMVVPTDRLRPVSGALKWAKTLRRQSRAEGVLVASVVPPVDGNVRRSIKRVFGKSPEFVTSNRNIGIKIKVKKPTQVGADR